MKIVIVWEGEAEKFLPPSIFPSNGYATQNKRYVYERD
jgi:hypothetical protein